MRCPTCNGDLPDGLVRCTYCNTALPPGAAASLDELLGDPHASGVELFTSARGTQERGGEASPPPDGSQAQIHTRIVSIDPEQERGTRIIEVSIPQVVRRAGRQGSHGAQDAAGRRAAADEAESLGQGVDDLFDKLRLSYARMHRLDRITGWVALLALVSAFLPWRFDLVDGLLAGIQGLGAASAAAAAGVLCCIFARTVRRRLTGLLLTLQIVVAGICTAVPIFVFLGQTGLSSKYGLYMTAVTGAAVTTLTLLRLAVRNF